MSLTLLPRELDDSSMGDFSAASAASSGGGGREDTPPRASQACVSCKRQKRRCDKVVPVCSLCRRMGRACDYAEAQPPPPTADDLASLQARLAELEARLNHHAMPGLANNAARTNSRDPMWLSALSRFPTAVFLDIDCFHWAGMPIPKPPVDIPLEVLAILSEGGGVQQVAADYFATIHLWFPIVSKKRLNLGLPLWDSGPDLAMLFLAMRLITSRPTTTTATSTHTPDWPPPPGPPPGPGQGGPGGCPPSSSSAADNPIYLHSKRFLALLETSGTVSVLYLQALSLVALYEYSHAVYPAAWMTVGACARYCDVLGLPSYADSVGILGQCTTWTETEERRRVWWGVFVLDRVISLGSKRRFACQDPPDHEPLPVADEAWDEGRMAHAFPLSIHTPVTSHVGPFARLCQVALHISRAVAHCQAVQHAHRVRGAPPIDVGAVASLSEPLAQMCVVVEAELEEAAAAAANALLDGDGARHAAAMHTYFGLVAPRGLVWSALVLVLDMYSCPENLRDGPGTSMDCVKTAEELALQTEAIDGMTKVSERIRIFGRDLIGMVLSATAVGPLHTSSSSSSQSPVSASGSASAATFASASAASASVSAVPELSLPIAGVGAGGGVGGVGGGGGGGGVISGIDCVSSLALDSLYCALAVFHWLWKESGDAEMERSLNDVVDVLSMLAPRWHLAEEYLSLQQHHDVTHIMALRAGR